MIAVAGGILIAVFVLMVLTGLGLVFRDALKFVLRHKLYVGALLGAAVLFAVISVAGSYSASYQSSYLQR